MSDLTKPRVLEIIVKTAAMLDFKGCLFSSSE